MLRIGASALIEAGGMEAVVSGANESLAANSGNGNAQRNTALIAHLVAAGYERHDCAILQPAATFLELAGEELRDRLFLTSDPAGAEFCLRPEFTIPVCKSYLASPQAGKPADFSYLGPVFRYRAQGVSEFIQAGIESFGRADRAGADADIMTIALEAAERAGAGQLTVKAGDAGLFSALLDALALDPVWVRRIKRGVARHQSLDQIFTPPANGASAEHSGVLAAIQGADKQGARKLVEDLLSIAGISSVSGRSASEIAERYLEQSTLQANGGFSAEKRAAIEAYLTIEGHPDDASAAARTLADGAQLDMNAALDDFDARLGFAAARGFDLARMNFQARFARNLDYYTGFVFEAADPANPGAAPVVAGGRYDGMLNALGAKTIIPAVGAAIWCDRLNTKPAQQAEQQS